MRTESDHDELARPMHSIARRPPCARCGSSAPIHNQLDCLETRMVRVEAENKALRTRLDCVQGDGR